MAGGLVGAPSGHDGAVGAERPFQPFLVHTRGLAPLRRRVAPRPAEHPVVEPLAAGAQATTGAVAWCRDVAVHRHRDPSCNFRHRSLSSHLAAHELQQSTRLTVATAGIIAMSRVRRVQGLGPPFQPRTVLGTRDHLGAFVAPGLPLLEPWGSSGEVTASNNLPCHLHEGGHSTCDQVVAPIELCLPSKSGDVGTMPRTSSVPLDAMREATAAPYG